MTMEERLSNWGRWARQGRVPGTSPLYRLVRQNNPLSGYGTTYAGTEPDEADALEIDSAIAKSCRAYEAKILRLRYINHMPPGWICPRVGILRKRFPEILLGIQKKVELALSGKKE